MKPAVTSYAQALSRLYRQVRAGELDAARAAEVVERCAEIAGRIGAELERAGREAERETADGQEQLL